MAQEGLGPDDCSEAVLNQPREHHLATGDSSPCVKTTRVRFFGDFVGQGVEVDFVGVEVSFVDMPRDITRFGRSSRTLRISVAILYPCVVRGACYLEHTVS